MICFNKLTNDVKVFGQLTKQLNHFKQICEFRRKNFKSSELFSDLVNFFCESSDF